MIYHSAQPTTKNFGHPKNNQNNKMKMTKNKSALRHLAKVAGGFLTLAAVLTAGNIANAHLSYSGRDFGSYSGLTNGTLIFTNPVITGNYGWADAADGVLGDSHKARPFRFHLDNQALVTLTASANVNKNSGTNTLGDLTPAFSVYSGLGAIAPFPPTQTALVPSADHDFSASSVAWRIWWVQQNLDSNATSEAPTDGSWNALGDWKIGGDGDLPGDFSQLSSFTYKGSAASTTSGGSVTGSFLLPAGDYTVMVGGNNLANKIASDNQSTRGATVTLSVSPIPALNIAQKVFVNWPSGTATNWVLQSSSSVNGPTWSNVTNAPVTVDGQPGVVLDRSASSQFFRFNYAQ
jgi:hypothetical protein